ncbi:unnamed protein product [Urochloa humidicola]
MSPRKRCRASTAAPPAEATTTPAPALPPDLVLEVIARSDAATLVRCAACSKPLRRDILSRAFIRRVCHHHGPGGAAAVPPRLLAFLQSYDKFFGLALSLASPLLPPPPFSLAHPATPAAARLFVSRAGAAGLLARYEPVTSRGGLVVLRRRQHRTTGMPDESAAICVYDPMAGARAFLPDSPEMANFSPDNGFSTYVLLTAASDGIGIGGSSSFLLLAVDFTMLMYPASSIKVRTFSSGAGEWGPAP